MIRLIGLLFALTACATVPTHPVDGYGEPLMWELSDEDTTIHIFGTIHALPKDLVWRTDKINAAFEAADTLCVETDVEGKADEYRAHIREHGYFPEGENLSDHLTDEQWADIVEVSEAVGIDPNLINAMKPWNAMFDLSLGVSMMLGLDQLSGVEFVLLPEANEKGKRICDMESPLDSVTSISSLPLETQLAVLTHEKEEFEGVEDLDVAFEMMREDIDEMVDTWMTGDFAAMDSEDILEEYGHIDFYNAILTKRNRNWIPRIVELLDEPGTKFIAVGSAHLAGPDSVIRMLRSEGYTVEGP